MSHTATVLEDGETMYVGMLLESGEYREVRLAHTPGGLLVTHPDGSFIAGEPLASE